MVSHPSSYFMWTVRWRKPELIFPNNVYISLDPVLCLFPCLHRHEQFYHLCQIGKKGLRKRQICAYGTLTIVHQSASVMAIASKYCKSHHFWPAGRGKIGPEFQAFHEQLNESSNFYSMFLPLIHSMYNGTFSVWICWQFFTAGKNPSFEIQSEGIHVQGKSLDGLAFP